MKLVFCLFSYVLERLPIYWKLNCIIVCAHHRHQYVSLQDRAVQKATK